MRRQTRRVRRRAQDVDGGASGIAELQRSRNPTPQLGLRPLIGPFRRARNAHSIGAYCEQGGTAVVYQARDVVEAIELAEQLRQQGEYDLFRGQLSAEWDCVPSLFRITDEMLEPTLARLARYIYFLEVTPELAEIAEDIDLATAVAQHHGLPTAFLDFTTDPRIAGFFATDGLDQEQHTTGAITLVNSSDFDELSSAQPDHELRIVRPTIPNLHRLQAQKGIFIHIGLPSLEHAAACDRIEFEHGAVDLEIARGTIYPEQDQIELLLRHYFDNESALSSKALILEFVAQWQTAGVSAGVIEYDEPSWEGRQGYFRLGQVPVHESWRNDTLHEWLTLTDEPFVPHSHRVRRALQIDMDAELIDVVRSASRQVDEILDDDREARDSPTAWSVLGPDGTKIDDGTNDLGESVDLLWDGVRRLPYENNDIAIGIGNCVGLLTARRRGLEEKAAVQEIFGEALPVGMSAADGSGTQGYAAAADIRSAFRPDILDYIAPGHHETFSRLRMAMQIVPWPRHLYDLESLAQLFACQIAPTQVVRYGPKHVIFFSPTRLKFFGLP